MRIKSIGLLLTSVIAIPFIFIAPTKVHAFSNPAAVPLSSVSNFAALAKSAITSPTGPTVLNNGDLGIASPGTCTDFAAPCSAPNVNGTINSGTIQFQNTAATTGQTDATSAVTDIGLRSSDQTIAAGLLGGLTLTQGVYDVPAAVTNLTGDLTLNGDANSVFIFHLTSTLITATGSRVLLTGGAQACNVFWKVDSSATFNGTTTMVGTVLSAVSTTFPGGGATLTGRVVAQTGAITFNNTTVNNSSCAATPTTTPTPTPTPGSSSVSTSASSPSTTGGGVCVATTITTIPIIIESKRIDSTSMFLSWGPFAELNTFTIHYGPTNGNWLYSTNVTGFSTTLSSLPANQPMWIQVAATNECSIGTYGPSVLVGAQGGIALTNSLIPRLPNTGFGPNDKDILRNIVIPTGILILVFTSFVIVLKKYTL